MPTRFTRLALLASLLGASACKTTPGVARGEALFNTCAKCHGQNGGGNQELSAPAIGGLPAWYVEAQLNNFMAAHRGYDPFDTAGIRMKSIAWTLDREGDPASVAAYVATLNPGRATPVLHGDPAKGQAAFQVCSACHGADASGQEAVHAPPLAGRSDWYLLAQLRKFKAGQRGTNPADIWGATMRAQAMALEDSVMTDVIAYIQTLQPAQSAPGAGGTR